MHLDFVISDLLLILSIGLVAGVVSRRMKFPAVVGYLVGGCMLGPGGFGVVEQRHHEIEALGELGVFFLLFSIGLEITPGELLRLGRKLVVGGSVQMLSTAVPLGGLLLYMGLGPRAASLIALAVSFSSTVLVFQALAEQGRTSDSVGRRVIGILLFQDAALVPLLLAVPLLLGSSSGGLLWDVGSLLVRSIAFGGGIAALSYLVPRLLMPMVCRDRSTTSVVLFSLVVLGGVTRAAHVLGLPPVVGAFFAGLVLSGSRWTSQIEAVVLPFREAFAAIFFCSLGLLLPASILTDAPMRLAGLLAACLGIKTFAGALALWSTGVPVGLSLRLGAGLAHIGEFAFVLALSGLSAGLVTPEQYGFMIAIGLMTLVLAPPLLRSGMAAIGQGEDDGADEAFHADDVEEAVVIGAGPVGQRVCSTLEMRGVDVCMVDISPVNLQQFAQLGFRTVAGDASRPQILEAAGVRSAGLTIVCVPDDEAAKGIVKGLRALNRECQVLVRCRYQGNCEPLRQLGADHVVSEEARIAQSLVDAL